MDNRPNPAEPPVSAGLSMCRILQAAGVETVFCLAGAAHAYLLREMAPCGITVISTRTEAGTVAAADGYARVKGGLGVAMIAGKQGLPNAVGGVRTAQLACSPVLILASVYDAPSTEALGEEGSDPLVATACRSQKAADPGRHGIGAIGGG